MASDKDFAEYIKDQMEGAGEVSCRKMFGEFALYCDGKVVGLICDNRVFIKPTVAGRTHIGEVVEGIPYPNAKPQFLIEDRFEDRDWFVELVRLTAQELPAPKPKRLSSGAKSRRT